MAWCWWRRLQILQQIEHVVNFSSWTTEDELLPFIPPFLHTADGDELQVRPPR